MATIKDIAERAGVSIGTVDRVIHNRGRVSEETRKTILDLVRELDYRPNRVSKGLSLLRKNIKLSFFVPDSLNNPFFGQVRSGAQEKSKELTEYGIEVEYHIIPALATPFAVPENFSTDGIAMLYLPTMEPLCQWAMANNVPVVCFNVPAPDHYPFAYVGCDYRQAGRIAAGLTAIICGGAGRVGILSEGTDLISSYGDREKGFRQEIREHYPQIQLAPSYTTTYSESLKDSAIQMLADHPDLDLIYLVNPGDYSVCRIIHETAGKPIQIVTNDLVPAQRHYLTDGIITATICQEPERQGATSLEILFQYIVNGSIPDEKNILTNLTIHISQNA